MPDYKLLTEFTTFLIPTARRAARGKTRRRTLKRGHREGLLSADIPELVGFLNKCAQEHQLAAEWSETDLLKLTEFGLSRSKRRIALSRSGVAISKRNRGVVERFSSRSSKVPAMFHLPMDNDRASSHLCDALR